MTNIAVIVPAYNEARVISDTLRDLRAYLNKSKLSGASIIVVDDGSSDDTGEIATNHADYVLTHRENCGLGAAISTGIEFVKRGNYDICITFDSDGQHDPMDIAKALNKLKEGYDVVVGSRFLGSHSRMPRGRQFILKISNFITWIFFGVVTTDSQSGFRALARKAIDSISLKSNRMEVSSEFFGEINSLGLRYTEVPIHIRYTDYSLTKGQSNSNALNVLIKLLYKLAR